ncbi:unnamed protein product [Mesocestoides corti]|uniref:Signal recognition particle subunit SRP72 n=1 Tax=Mesocestoides corti TaxID=53468 RepID=A0A0R3UEM0_MESCO|nr:unnamed protein product [Mesocestoides corti]
MTHKQAALDLDVLINDLGKACRSASYSKVVTICDKKFEKAIEGYDKLMQTYQDDYQEERLTNLLAAKAALSCFQGKSAPLNYSPAMFETDFNAACYFIGRRDYSSALKYLNKAEKLCLETFENETDISEDQINQEVAPIRAQKGFVLQQQKKDDAASEIYHTILRQRSGDPPLTAVIANNLICINKGQNVFDTRKRIKASSIDGLQHKLFQAQRSSILVNQALFYLHNNQLDACHSRVKTVLDEDPSNIRGVILSAVHLTRCKQLAGAIKVLEYFTQSPAFEDVDGQGRLLVALLLVHLQLMAASGAPANVPSAPLRTANIPFEVVETLSRQLCKLLSVEQVALPATASLRVALLLATKASDGDSVDEAAVKCAKTLVLETLDFWCKRSSNKVDNDRLLARCIDFFRFHGFAEDAAILLEKRISALKSSGASDDAAKKKQQSLLALLIQAYSKFDQVKASQASRDLEFTEALGEKDIDSLESTFLFGVKGIKKFGRGPVLPTPKTGGKSGGSGVVEKKHKKKRKLRLPKNYEPGVPPDPERWLPRRERTGYRGKRRDRRQVNLLRGPQGATSSVAPEL